MKLIITALTAIFLIGCSIDFSVSSWSEGEIPYYLKGDFTDVEIADLENAMDAWESVADVHFYMTTPSSSAYEIRRVYDQGWSSTVGENNTKCYMNFKADAPLNRYEHIIHELGHCLGLYHEHQRPDRDSYVKVFFENILSSEAEEFDKRDNPLYVESDFPYDYHSIMHYPEYAFSINGEKTIESVTETPVDRTGLITENDAARMQYIYGVPKDSVRYYEFLYRQVSTADESYRRSGE